jgi:hypothetical protein
MERESEVAGEEESVEEEEEEEDEWRFGLFE